jgi:hypothetical protein
MSTVAESLDLRSSLAQWVTVLGSFYAKDLLALPEDQLLVSPGGVCKTPQVITGEVVGLCRYATQLLRGEEPTSTGEEDAATAMQRYVTGAQLTEVLGAAVSDLSAAISAASEETWGREVTPPWGMPSTVGQIAIIAVNHIWYHDGQLNTYQALMGDGKVHWQD